MPMQFCISLSEALTKQCAADPDYRCVASGCMAWRWVITHINNPGEPLFPSGDTHGYCGLAGPPWSGK